VLGFVSCVLQCWSAALWCFSAERRTLVKKKSSRCAYLAGFQIWANVRIRRPEFLRGGTRSSQMLRWGIDFQGNITTA
jgi:hypothetical protein